VIKLGVDVADLTEYFDKVEIDLKADLSDWHKVRKELLKLYEKKR
jgi:hypothetical protein